MILGTADVFSVDPRTAALIKHRLRNADLDTLDETLTLAALADFCIYVPPDAGTTTEGADSMATPPSRKKHGRHRLLSPSSAGACSVHQLAKAIQRRDPLGTGYHAYGIDLLHRLLKWTPSERITLHGALTHAYFVGPYVSGLDGSEHMTAADLEKHHAHVYDDDDDANDDADNPSMNININKGTFVPPSLSSTALVSSTSSSALVTSDPSCPLTEDPVMCLPSSQQAEVFNIRDGLCNIANGVRNLMGNEKTSENDSDVKNIFTRFGRRHLMPLPASRFHYSMSETWRGNFSNFTKTTSQKRQSEMNNAAIAVELGEKEIAAALLPTALPPVPLNTILNQEHDILFMCPQCHRIFPVWDACHQHITSRKHGSKCRYVAPASENNTTHQTPKVINQSDARNKKESRLQIRKKEMLPATLPSCLSSHALLDIGYDPSSGWCDLQGRRAYLEDTHAIRFEKEYKFFGVFDGRLLLHFIFAMWLDLHTYSLNTIILIY
jgi:hypothetical protein